MYDERASVVALPARSKGVCVNSTAKNLPEVLLK